MSIVLKTAPVDPPLANDDWTRTQDLITMLFLGNNGPILRVVGGNIVKGSVFQIGGAIYYADSDTAITGSASDYVKITPAGATASASYVADLSGVSWSDEYNGYVDVSGNLYIFDEGLALSAGEISECHKRYLHINENGVVNIAEANITEANITEANITEANITEANITEANIDNTYIYGFGVDIGNIDISGMGAPAVAMINSTTIAFIDSDLEQLRTYTWSGSAWSLSGSGLSIPGVGAPSICALSTTDIAMIDLTTRTLTKYHWDGSSWAQVGNGLTLIALGNSAIASLDSDDVAVYGSTIQVLRTYHFDGTDWALSGSELSLTGAGAGALAPMDSTHVVFLDSANEELRTYTWSGSAWSLSGDVLSLTPIGSPVLAKLDSSHYLVVDDTNKKFSTYYWDGTKWYKEKDGLPIIMDTWVYIAITAISDTEIVFANKYFEKLSLYKAVKLLT